MARGRKYQNGRAITLTGANTGPRTESISTKQTRKPHNSEAFGTQEDLASVVGNNWP